MELGRVGLRAGVLAGTFALASFLIPSHATAQASTLVPSGVDQVGYPENVQGLIAPGAPIFWSTAPTCGGGPIGIVAGDVAAPAALGDETSPALLTRGATYGPTPRKLFEFNPPRAPGVCNPYRLFSNLAVDEGWIYYVDNQGPNGNAAIWRRSRDANPGDPSQLLRDTGSNLVDSAELITFGPWLFAILRAGSFQVLAEYWKDTGGVIDNAIVIASSLRDMQWDGRYLYWNQDGNLVANDTTNGSRRIIAFGVSTYLVFGYLDEYCYPGGCDPAIAYVTYAESNGPPSGNRILTQDHLSGYTYVEYTAPVNFSISNLASSSQYLFFFIRGPAPFGGPFDREERMIRTSFPGPSAGSLIYGPFVNHAGFDSVIGDYGEFVYFRERATGKLLRIPTNTAAIPVRQLRATGLEVTQGIQNPANDVMLVEGRRTFVRFYVRSDGPTPVNAVAARLSVFGPGGFLGTLDPANGVNKLLNVLQNPQRRNLGDSFLFELPLSWTNNAYLSFSATVNPFAAIIENDYGNNTAQTPILILSESPRLPLETISWWYSRNNAIVFGTTYDNLRSEWHLRNLYPIAYQGGLQATSRVIQDDLLQPQVDRTDTGCNNMRGPTPTKPADDRNQCAADYVMGRVRALKAAGTLPNDRYYYSAIADDGTTPFTRGYALTGERSASGPMTDTTAGGQQNYMAHEVGHLLGRGHPGSGANPVCPNQDAADASYPYPQARIGNSTTATNDETAHMGLDPGDFTTSPKTIRPASTTGDTMSYCSPHGISNYTYDAMWLWMSLTNPLGGALQRAAGAPAAAFVAGDWLLVHGTLSDTAGAATFTSVQRRDSVAEVPALVAGGYRLELRSAANALLASHAFTPEAIEDGGPGFRGFGLVVPWVAGTRTLRLVKGTSQVLATHAVSPNAPAVGDVGLVGAVEPVTGEVDVAWTASDPDGGALRFDLLYSHDDGASWRPVRLSLAGTAARVDTSELPGGTGRFRVEASDGAQTARAESAPFQVARKAPRIVIDSPADGTRLAWGQLVNFVASVADPQGGAIAPAQMVWENAYRTLGTGPVVSVTDLEVGENLVTLTVTDSQGQSSLASVTVLVGDDVTYPGARLSASPSPVAWQVPGNSSAVVEQALLVRNAGGGSLRFRITSSQPWLLVNGAASVTANADTTLTVRANASGLPEPAVSEAALTIENLGDPEDSLVVPVSLFKGSLAVGEPFADADADGVDDRSDDCIGVADGPALPGDPALDQRDTDGDGFGNACDPDLNGDGVVNFADLAILKLRFFSSDPQADFNGDGAVNFADLARLKVFFLKPPGPSAKAP